MSASLVPLHVPETPWSFRHDPIVIGKDILEILSSAMYVDPLAIYREYIQNAADSIDEARKAGILSPIESGSVEINIDLDKRSVTVRDNGVGLPEDEFEAKLTSFGASGKRGSNARGFRGVGRLSGLAYCQELLFRSRSAGEDMVSELRWDCRKAKALLRSNDFSGDLAEVVAQSVQVRRIKAAKYPEHFFEVELRSVPRLRSDFLLNATVIEDYLSQVGPLPFAPDFRFREAITATLHEHLDITDITLRIDGSLQPTSRPHRDSFQIAGGVDAFSELQRIQIPGMDGGVAAIGWVLHHGYKGAVPGDSLKGFRLRSGNIQVGTNSIVEDLFSEPRFNSWCVGELHVIDPRIIPNGRRDHYEQNVHYTNLINHLTPVARDISTRCRQSSIRRNCLRQIERQQDQVRRDLEIVKQGSLSASQREVFTTHMQETLNAIEKTIAKEALKADAPTLGPVLAKLRRDLSKVSATNYRAKALANLAPIQRRAYENVFGLMYECAPDKSSAKLLVDRMLARLARILSKKS